jgi:hypothetical protein
MKESFVQKLKKNLSQEKLEPAYQKEEKRKPYSAQNNGNIFVQIPNFKSHANFFLLRIHDEAFIKSLEIGMEQMHLGESWVRRQFQ